MGCRVEIFRVQGYYNLCFFIWDFNFFSSIFWLSSEFAVSLISSISCWVNFRLFKITSLCVAIVLGVISWLEFGFLSFHLIYVSSRLADPVLPSVYKWQSIISLYSSISLDFESLLYSFGLFFSSAGSDVPISVWWFRFGVLVLFLLLMLFWFLWIIFFLLSFRFYQFFSFLFGVVFFYCLIFLFWVFGIVYPDQQRDKHQHVLVLLNYLNLFVCNIFIRFCWQKYFYTIVVISIWAWFHWDVVLTLMWHVILY